MLRRLTSNRLLRVFSSSVIDQAMLSAANFVVGILLIRYTSDSAYGLYVLAFTGIALAGNAQGAWISGPLTILAPKRSDAEATLMLSSIKHDQTRFLLVIVLPLFLAASALGIAGLLDRTITLVLLAGIFAGWMQLRREYVRNALLIHSDTQTLLKVDGFFVAVQILLTLVAAFGPIEAAPMAVLAMGLAAWAGGFMAHRALGNTHGWVTPVPAGHYWREMRPLAVWSTAGALIYWVSSQGYNYVLAIMLDTKAVAAANVARLLLMPAYLMTMGIRSAIVPLAARWLVEFGYATVLRRITLFVVGLFGLFLIYFVLLLAEHNWVLTTLLHKQLPDAAVLLTLWCVLCTCGLVRDLFMSALVVRERLRLLAYLAAIATALTMVCIWPAIHFYGVRGAMISLLVGEAFYVTAILWFCLRELTIEPPANPDPPLADPQVPAAASL